MGYLPDRYRQEYTPRFPEQFAVFVIPVNWKLAQTEPCQLSSVAEELVARAILEEARGVIALEQGQQGPVVLLPEGSRTSADQWNLALLAGRLTRIPG